MCEYEIIRSKRKTVSVQITRDAKVVVRAPMKMAASQIGDFVKSHEAWIAKHLGNAERETQKRLSFTFSDGQPVYFLGREYTLQSVFADKSIKLSGQWMLVPAKIPAEKREREIKKFLSKQAKEHLSQRVRDFAPFVGASPQAVTITSAKTRWGSCSGKNRISFSFRLICLPPELIDYVVAHELTHILEHSHSKRFYSLLARVLPDYERRWQDLKVFSKKLLF